MNTIIIQPGDPTPQIKGRIGFNASHKHSFSPEMHLLALNSFININSRHKSIFIDSRIFADPKGSLLTEIENTPIPRVAVIDIQTVSLDLTLDLIDWITNTFPDIYIGLCGQHANECPEHCMEIGQVDFVLSGDPEPILKQYLDYIDLPQRLAKSPGLQLPKHAIQEPAYLANLGTNLPGPAWPPHFWSSYRMEAPETRCEADFRVTRGNSGTPPDRAHPEYDQPLRVYDLRMMSSLLERCSAVSVNHINISDPPGVWTKDFLLTWCKSLSDYHVRQSWGLKLLPAALSRAEHTALYNAWCKRVDFVFPSCDPTTLKKYGCLLDLPALYKTIETLKKHHIRPTIRYWLGGPEAPQDEAEQCIKTIRALGYCDFILQPFPYHWNSDIYDEYASTHPGPSQDDFIAWSKAPESFEKPIALWGGKEGQKKISKTAAQILKKVNRSPGRILKRFTEQMVHTPWIDKFETKSASIDVIGPPTRGI